MSSGLCYLAAILALFAFTEASHGRFGTISFTKSPTDPQTVTFSVTVADRRDYFYPLPVVGNTIYDIDLDFGDGGADYLNMVVTSVNTQDDWLTATWSGTHRYAGAGTYTATISSCCRLIALNNNGGYSYQFTALVKITAQEISKATAVNNSPVSGMLPIINVDYGVADFQYQLLATDPEGDSLVFSNANSAYLGEGGSTQPTGLSVSANGLVTLYTQLAKGYWQTQQIVTDSFGNFIVIDYLLLVADPTKYCNGSCQNSQAFVCTSNADCVTCNSQCLTAVPRVVVNSLSSGLTPATNLPAPIQGSTITVPMNQLTTLSFVVDDVNLVNPATAPYIYTSSIPTYGSVTAQQACTAANGCTYVGSFQKPQFIQVRLTPPQSAQGTTQVVCVGASSLGNPLPAQYCVSININVQVCGNEIVETGEQCDGGACCTSSCTFVASGTVCRSAEGACDTTESCTGASSICPADVILASGTICRASAGSCDVAESCDGSSTSCPADGVAPSSQVCRASAGVCDVAESCDGSSTSCPADGVASSSQVCRASAGVCDVAESCDGSSTSCPADSFASSGVCRASAGICDVAESCSGSSASCPADSFASSGVCRASAGVCDVAESCSGSSASCPADSLASSTHVCRPVNGSCDIAEYCTGSSTACPADAFNTSTPCQAASIVCPRLQIVNGTTNYFCSSDASSFYMCLDKSQGTSNKMKCASSTHCNCAYGVECSCHGAVNPCMSGTQTPSC